MTTPAKPPAPPPAPEGDDDERKRIAAIVDERIGFLAGQRSDPTPPAPTPPAPSRGGEGLSLMDQIELGLRRREDKGSKEPASAPPPAEPPKSWRDRWWG